MNKAMRKLIKKYRHIIVIIYLPLYSMWFLWLEHRTDLNFTYLHCVVDDWIPFQEIFIIPYLIWFLYVALALVALFFQTRHLNDFYRCCSTLMLGMTICLIIYTVWPNAQNLRPDVMPRNNLFTHWIGILYSSDTCTNVCPSIHVYNSLCIHFGLTHSNLMKNKKGWKLASLILCILICLSTLFLKQHSFIDLVAAVILFLVTYTLIYNPLHRSILGARIKVLFKETND